jgi:SagB-type dehydrogenase family enzyme
VLLPCRTQIEKDPTVVDLSRRTVTLLPAGVVPLLAGCRPFGVTSGDLAARRAARTSALPPPATSGRTPLEVALAGRRSVRDFTGEPLTRSELGQLMWAAQGVTHDVNRRTAPSAGALYPLELYAATPDAVMHYLPDGHQVQEWASPGGWAALLAATPSEDAVEGAGAAFVVAAAIRRTAVKYGGQARSYVDLEAGHAAQNLLLQAVALGLGAVPIGAFNEGRLARVLGLPAQERALYLVPVGRPAS